MGDVPRLSANVVPLYIRNVSIYSFGYPWWEIAREALLGVKHNRDGVEKWEDVNDQSLGNIEA